MTPPKGTITLDELAFIVKNMNETIAIELCEIESCPDFIMAADCDEYDFLKDIEFPAPTTVSIKHIASKTKYLSQFFCGEFSLHEQTDTGLQSLAHLLSLLKIKARMLIQMGENQLTEPSSQELDTALFPGHKIQ